MPSRKIPLRRKTPMRRGTAVLRSVTPLRRAKALKPVSAKRRASTERMRATRHLVAEASGGACALCGRPLPVVDDGSYVFDDHHVAQRGVGGTDDPGSRVALHHHCHMWVHEHIAEARALGMIRDSWETA